MISRLEMISLSESIKYSPSTLSTLVSLSEGDMRRCITLYQSTVKLRGKENLIRPEDVVEVCGVIPDTKITQLLNACKSNSFRNIELLSKDMIYEGYSVEGILYQFGSLIRDEKTISDNVKGLISIRLGESEHKLIEGADQLLQLLDVLSFTQKQIQQGN
jgi:replication factor C subunit 2/4